MTIFSRTAAGPAGATGRPCGGGAAAAAAPGEQSEPADHHGPGRPIVSDFDLPVYYLDMFKRRGEYCMVSYVFFAFTRWAWTAGTPCTSSPTYRAAPASTPVIPGIDDTFGRSY